MPVTTLKPSISNPEPKNVQVLTLKNYKKLFGIQIMIIYLVNLLSN